MTPEKIDQMCKELYNSGNYSLGEMLQVTSVYYAFVAMQNRGMVPDEIYTTYGEQLKECTGEHKR